MEIEAKFAHRSKPKPKHEPFLLQLVLLEQVFSLIPSLLLLATLH